MLVIECSAESCANTPVDYFDSGKTASIDDTSDSSYAPARTGERLKTCVVQAIHAAVDPPHFKLLDSIQRGLASCPYHELRCVQVRLDGDTVHIEGNCSSYYVKQMAQVIVRRHSPLCTIKNEVRVEYPESRKPRPR